jgi:two-component system NtrC family response regulator
VLAQGLHAASKRAGRFVAINCAAIPENLLESELFGYEKGAFTGAGKTTPGKIETANNGTLMLDEIGDLPQSLQAKLLRFLEQRTIERLGGRQEIAVDVRVVCATHQDLKTLIAEGRFREDLYYRLAEIVVTIPPLRQRVGDAVMLAHAFVRRFAQEQRRGALALSDDAVRAIEQHPWPGNVRELLNAVKRASIMCEGDRLTPEDLGLPSPTDNVGERSDLDLRSVREAAERQAILAALARTNDNVVKSAEMLGVSRPTLYDLMRRLAIR